MEKRSREQGCCAGAGVRFPPSPRWTPGLWRAWRHPPLAGCGKHKALQGGRQPFLCSRLILIAKLPAWAARPTPSSPPGPGGAKPSPQGRAPSHPACFCGPLGVGPVAPVARDTGSHSQTSLDNGSAPFSAPSSPHPPPGLTPPPPPPAFEKLPTMAAAWGTQPTLRTRGYAPPGGPGQYRPLSCTCSRSSLTGPRTQGLARQAEAWTGLAGTGP